MTGTVQLIPGQTDMSARKVQALRDDLVLNAVVRVAIALLPAKEHVHARVNNATLLQPQHRQLCTQHYCRARGYNSIPHPTNSELRRILDTTPGLACISLEILLLLA